MKKIPKQLKTVLKFAFVVALLTLLAKKGFISVEATGRAFSNWQRTVPTILLMIFSAWLGAIRWQWLLRAQNIHMKAMRTFQLTFIGNFFNIALPGAVSGDFVKAFYVAKEVKGEKSRAFGSILFDRVAGMSALVLVSAGALLSDYNALHATPLFAAIRFMITIAAVCVISFYAYLFLVREHHDPVLGTLKRLSVRYKKAGTLTRIYESLRHYHNHRLTVLKVLVISILIHLITSTVCISFLYALGETDIHPLSSVYVVVPLGLLVTAVPIMPAGVGTGHAAFGWLFSFLGTQRGADVFSLYALSQLLVGAIGGVIYLRFRTHEPTPPLENA